MKKTNLLALTDLDQPMLERLAARAIELSDCWQNRAMPLSLRGARIGMIEELPGWRNPTALALGVAQMGGTCVKVTARLEGRETVEDLAGYMDNWFDLLAVRTPRLSRLRAFADAFEGSVLNLRTNDNHPCEILGDLAFVVSQRGSWDGLRVAMVGAAGNIARSWIEAAETLPIEVMHLTSQRFHFPAELYGPRCRSTNDPRMIEDADLIVTDCWPSNVSDAEKEHLAAFRIDASRLDRCRSDVLFVPCPPVTRSEEVTDDAMRHSTCVATSAKAFLMHVQIAFAEAMIDTSGDCAQDS